MNASWGRAGLAILIAASFMTAAPFALAQQPPFASRPKVTAFVPMANYVTEASRRFGIPQAWIRAVMQVESAGDIDVTSPAGAMGLMQVMPQTYAELRAALGLGANAYDPHDNIIAGAAYLRGMHDRYGDRGFLAAYNAGPARYDEFQSGGRALPNETVRYVARLGPVLGVQDVGELASDVPFVAPRPEDAPIFVTFDKHSTVAAPRSNATQNARLAAAELQTSVQTDGLFVARGMSSNSTSVVDRLSSPVIVPSQKSHVQQPKSVSESGHSDDIFVHRSVTRTPS